MKKKYYAIGALISFIITIGLYYAPVTFYSDNFLGILGEAFLYSWFKVIGMVLFAGLTIIFIVLYVRGKK